MTAILRLFSRTDSDDHVNLVREAAQRSVGIVGRQLPAHVASMNVGELRGYVRARAALVVRKQVLESLALHSLPADHCDALITAVLERTVHQLVQDLTSPPIVAIPAPHVRLRIAA